MRRRDLLACGICSTGFGFHRLTGAQGGPQGCLLMNSDPAVLGVEKGKFGALGNALEDSSGDSNLDKSLGRALARAAGKFGVAPSFAFYRDGSKPNAYASSMTMTSGTWGSVVFGRSLFQDQLNRYKDGGVSVLAIVAHEFGHILQYRNKMLEDLQASEPTVRRIELHADYLSGWYLGLRKKEDPSISLWGSGDTFKRIGDYEYTNPNHHGTPEQRVAASEAGFKLSKSGATISGALQEGRTYVRNLKI
jgi:hypothetical protein